MKILFYRWQSTAEEDCISGLKALGAQVDECFEKMDGYVKDKVFSGKMRRILTGSGHYDYVFSINFFPLLSECCQECGIKYISWVYDCPHYTLYSQAVLNNCNRIFLFDYCMYSMMKEDGIKNIFYQPLAVNTGRLERQRKEYAGGYLNDVAFVGSLYRDEYNFYDQITNMPDYLKGYFDGLIQMQMMVSGYDFLNEMVDGPKFSRMREIADFSLGPGFFHKEKEIFLNMLRRKMTSIERVRYLEAVSGRFALSLYTGDKGNCVPGAKRYGYISYRDQMPEVFARSKINLNLSLRSILSGIPMRVLDIMGAGGFALTDERLEIPEYFTDGQDLAVYRSPEECLGIIEYYLVHEKERKEIAENGRHAVQTQFTYEKQLAAVLESAG